MRRTGMSFKLSSPGEGKHLNMLGDILSIMLSKNETNGTYSILESKVYPGGGPPPHLQTREFEGFYILEGELDFIINGKQVTSKTGTVINIPPRVVHSFKNNTDNIVRILVIIAPAGLEKMFEEVGTEVSEINLTKPSIEEKTRLLEISKKYGVEMIE
jgi:quercetin dioxygenase-like cupin family protein